MINLDLIFKMTKTFNFNKGVQTLDALCVIYATHDNWMKLQKIPQNFLNDAQFIANNDQFVSQDVSMLDICAFRPNGPNLHSLYDAQRAAEFTQKFSLLFYFRKNVTLGWPKGV